MTDLTQATRRVFQFLRRWKFALLCCLTATAIWPIDLSWARAGGGGSYSGGGGGGGGGGGLSGGGGGSGSGGEVDLFELLYLIYWLCRYQPWFGFPLVAVLCVMGYYAAKETNQTHVTRTIRKGQRKQRERVRDETLARIKSHDPAFDLPAFMKRAKTAFTKIQYAWSEQNLSSVRPFISDGIHERFSLQIDMQKAEGYRNVMENVSVHRVDAVAIFSTSQFDTIHLEVTASAVDYNADLKTGKRRGDKSSATFVEYWSFHRRPGAKSLKGKGTIEGNCPRCGSQLDVVDRAECNSCGAHVNSGEYDWVLAEITQEQEWNVPKDVVAVTGLAELASRDPGFSIQHIEDRVSVMFWRLKASEFYRDDKYARAVVSPDYQTQAGFRVREGEFWKDPAVGKVEMIDVNPEGENDQFDTIRVMIRWSGKLLEKLGGKKIRTLRDQAIYTHVYHLMRNRDAKSPEHATFTSAGCSNCGAPIDVNKEGACKFCGAVLNTGKYDWVLTEVTSYSASMAYQKLKPIPIAGDEYDGALGDANADVGLSLAVLAKVLMIDGEFSDVEREALNRLGKHRNLNREQVEKIVARSMSDKTNIPLPQDSQQAALFLDQLVHVVLADGQITRKEKKLLDRFAEKSGLAEADIRLAINRERKRSYQAARHELRQGKSMKS